MTNARGFIASLLVLMVVALATAAPQLTPAQQQAADKITAAGGLVLQLAADSDALVVNFSLAGKNATDSIIAPVKDLPKIAHLNLAGAAVTDSGLAAIAGLGDLTQLHLERTAITDVGLAHLKNLAKLEYLNLYGTGVTDAGITQLAGLKNLKRLYLWQTKVTDAGVAQLKGQIPALIVNRGEELAIIAQVAQTVGPKPGNTVCPVSGKPADAQFTFAYNGKTVGFCCNKCCAAFAKEPKKFEAKLKFDVPAATPATPADKKDDKKPDATAKPPVAAAVNKTCPVSGKDVDASVTYVYEGKTIAFCCKNCCGQFAKDPTKFAANVK